jgi:hypothetical protein
MAGGIEYLYEILVIRSLDIDDDHTDYRISNIVRKMRSFIGER